MAVSSSEASSKTPEFEITNKRDMEDVEIEPLVVSSSKIDGEETGGVGQEADTTHDVSVSGGESDVVNVEVSRSLTGRKVKRYLQLYGHEGRANDVIYAPPLSKEYLETDVQSSTRDHDQDRLMIYFGGDLQDFPEAMDIMSAESREHIQWNLEATTAMLQNQFTDRHIIVIRPCRLQDRIYSCFDNFLPTAGHGNPEHTPHHGALLHLRRLLRVLARRINDERLDALMKPDDEIEASQTRIALRLKFLSKGLPGNSGPVDFESADISIVGFSKGCVVLNQFLYEFHYLKTLTPDDESFEEFLGCLHDMYWLDGGHSGSKNTWIISRCLLETLTRLNIRIHVHVTPYQIGDDQRLIIRREERLFSNSLRSFGASIQRYVHFESLPPSLSAHFQLLTEFGAPATPNTLEGEDWEGEDCGGMPSYEAGRKLPERYESHSVDLMADEEDEED